MKEYKIGNEKVTAPITNSLIKDYPPMFNALSEIRLQNALEGDSESFYMELEKSQSEMGEDVSDDVDLEFGEFETKPFDGQRGKAKIGSKDPKEEKRFTIEEALDDFRRGTGLMGGNIKRIGLVMDPPDIDFEDWYICNNCGIPSRGDELNEDGSCPICDSITTPRFKDGNMGNLESAEEVWHFQTGYSNKSNSRIAPAQTWNWYNWLKGELLNEGIITRRDVKKNGGWFQYSARSALMSEYWAFESENEIFDHKSMGSPIKLKGLEWLYLGRLNENKLWWKDVADPIDASQNLNGSSTVRFYKLNEKDRYIAV